MRYAIPPVWAVRTAGITVFAFIALTILHASRPEALPALLSAASFPSRPPSGDPAPHCPADPYLQPGLLHLVDGAPAETRWLPLISPAPSETTYDAVRDSDDALGLGLSDVETLLVDLAQGRLAELEWARDRVVVLVGSSHDRNNVEHLASIVGAQYRSWGGHFGGSMTVPSLNLTFVNYFLFGMIDDEAADWFEVNEVRPITFEQRLLLLEARRVADGIGEPSLGIASSLFWDEKLFLNSQHAERHHPLWVGLTLPEARWHLQRVSSLLETLQQLWPASRLMVRTRHHRGSDWPGAQLRIAQLDASCRAAAARMPGVRLFDWGPLLEGYKLYSDKDQHFALGPTTYLVGDMLLFYLRAAVLPGCWTL